MGRIKLLENVIQHYAWGSCTAIPEMLNIPAAADVPSAEMWMGAHPGGASRIVDRGRTVSLETFIRQYPEEILGRPVIEKFGTVLPFLFKVLAAAQPLSIQAHPDRKQAEKGFLRETRAGISLNAPGRNYKDTNHKPECLCALTSFSALCGFRNPLNISGYFSTLFPESGHLLTGDLHRPSDGSGLRRFFHRLLTMNTDTVHDIMARAVDVAGRRADRDRLSFWIIRLHQAYPDDIMALAPAFLNLVELSPRQAMFLPSGVLHTYLEGVGIELMAASDNVLRGGLTAKHIDTKELLGVLDFSSMTPRLLAPVRRGECEEIYETDTEEFVLSVIRLLPGKSCSPHDQGRVAILLCVDGGAVITDQDNEETIPLARGASAIIPAAVKRYTLSGEAVIFKAAVPLQS